MKKFSFLVATAALFSTTSVIADLETKSPIAEPTASVTLHTNDSKSTATIKRSTGHHQSYTLSNSNPKVEIPVKSGKLPIPNIYTIEGFSKGTTCKLPAAQILGAGKSYLISLHEPESETSVCRIDFYEKK